MLRLFEKGITLFDARLFSPRQALPPAISCFLRRHASWRRRLPLLRLALAFRVAAAIAAVATARLAAAYAAVSFRAFSRCAEAERHAAIERNAL